MMSAYGHPHLRAVGYMRPPGRARRFVRAALTAGAVAALAVPWWIGADHLLAGVM